MSKSETTLITGTMEDWNNEHWNTGKLEDWKIGKSEHHSTIPSFHPFSKPDTRNPKPEI
jgi:hypothetical protein